MNIQEEHQVKKESDEDRFNKLRKICREKAFHSFAFGYVFDKKAHRYKSYINLLTVFGIVVPSAIGATAIGYGINAIFLSVAISIAIPLTIGQLIFSIFSVVGKWDEELAYAYEASQDLNLLYDAFKKISDLPPDDFIKFNIEYELLNTRYKDRVQQNSKHNIKEWEQRMGMRFGLREFQWECIGCNTKPKSMESTDCDICGKFDRSIFYKLFKP